MTQQREKIDHAVNRHFGEIGGSVLFSKMDPLVYLPLHTVPKRWRWALSRIARYSVRGGITTHNNYRTFHTALTSFEPVAGARIFESGSSAYGTNSTSLLSTIAEIVDCGFDTVDINLERSEWAGKLLKQLNHHAHCMDSVEFLRNSDQNYCFAYLDSFDLVAGNYKEAAEHGLNEFLALHGKLTPGAFILIDDTPRSPAIFRSIGGKEQEAHAIQWLREHGIMPGKGAHVVNWLRRNRGYEIVDWGYQLVIRYNPI